MKMKIIALIAGVLAVLVGMAGTTLADGSGPAPNAGDGVSDGSGFDSPNEPNGSGNSGYGPGPAPNAGDGIPDGPGW